VTVVSTDRWKRARSHVPRAGLIAVLYVLTARLGFLLAGPPGNVTAVWPPSGIALAALLLWGRAVWPGIWLGSFAANTWFLSGVDGPVWADLAVSAMIATGSSIQSLVGERLARAFVRPSTAFQRPTDVIGFASVAMLVCTLAATIGTSTVATAGLVGRKELSATWATWYLGDLVGILVVTPLLVVWSRPASLSWRPARALEGAMLAAAILGAGHLLYGEPIRAGAYGHSPGVLFLPLIVWAAVRFGQRGVTLAAGAASAIIVGEAYFAAHWLVWGSPNGLHWLQISSGVVALTGLLLATSIAELRHAQEDLRAAHRDLEKRVAERTDMVEEQAALLRGLFEHAPDAILAVDASGRVIRANERVAAVFGWPPEELVGERIEQLLPDEYRAKHVRHRDSYAAQPHVRPMGAGLDLRGRRKDGTQFPVDIMLSPLETKQGPIVIAIVRDVTRRKAVEERLRQTGEQLRALTARVQDAREQERTAIAREVHDQLGQALTGLKMELSWMAKQLATCSEKAAHEAVVRALEIMVLTDGMIESVRRIARDLRPGLLDELGLMESIQWQAREFERRTGIACDVSGEVEELGLERPASTEVFRIFQEILANVARHAGGTAVRTTVAIDGGRVVLEVADNGRGISQEQIFDRRSLGLLGMQERAAMLGGDVRFDGTPGRGTTVTVRIPCASAEDAAFVPVEGGNP
jgi:PAS domain S-box-containing protein